jgi:hypothetical protein
MKSRDKHRKGLSFVLQFENRRFWTDDVLMARQGLNGALRVRRSKNSHEDYDGNPNTLKTPGHYTLSRRTNLTNA